MLFTMETRQAGRSALSRFPGQVLYIFLGILALFAGWQLASVWLPGIIVASPADTFVALWKLVAAGELWRHLGITLLRIILGILGGSIVGGALGILAGLKHRWRLFLEPSRWVLMTVPSIVILVLALLLFGLGSTQVIVMTAVITLPFTYVSTVEGMQSIDQRLVEMALVYNIPRGLRLTSIYLPGIGAAVMAGLTLAAGIGVRAAILAEFMGARDGIGHSLFISWTFLNTPELFSWILLTFVLLGIIEFGLLRPLRQILFRWQRTA
jgi:NitT/TauT family transport system permease protein